VPSAADLKKRLSRLRHGWTARARKGAERARSAWRGVDWRGLNPPAARAAAHPPDDTAAPPRTRRRRLTWPGAIAGAVALAVILFLAFFDWNMLRGPIGAIASAQTGRTVVLEGDLRVRLFTWTPRVEIGGLKIGNPDWGPEHNMAEVGNVAVAARLLPLLTGRLVLPLVSVQQPNVALLRDTEGRANWDFSNGRDAGEPFRLPPIHNFIIDDGRLALNDLGRRLTFSGVINASEQRTAAYERGFTLQGEGELNERAFELNVVGGPLINVRRDRPYPFNAEVRAGATRVLAQGRVPEPFNLGRIDADLTVSGEDLNDLYYLTGLALPNTAPYEVSGQLRRDGMVYHYTDFTGQVGRSDINGDARVDLRGERTFLDATLNSQLLDFADLAGLFGLPGASAAAAPGQRAEAQALAAQGRLLPDATLQAERIRAMDAEVTYTAQSVRAPNLPLEAVSLGVKLDQGVLTLDPIAFDFPSGRLTGTATVDAREDTPVNTVDLRVADIRLEQFIPAVDGTRPVSGTLMGRARLTGAGNSVRRAAGRADGAVSIVIPGGEMRRAFAELLGINVTAGLFRLWADDHSPTEIRCAVADFQVRDGVMYARRIVFDTRVVLVDGEGTVDLGDETLNLEFKGEPKEVRAVRAIAPITVGGRLRSPAFGVDAGAVVAQAGIGVALGALLSPLAAILPFVSPGLADNADCAALLAESRRGPAPTPG